MLSGLFGGPLLLSVANTGHQIAPVGHVGDIARHGDDLPDGLLAVVCAHPPTRIQLDRALADQVRTIAV